MNTYTVSIVMMRQHPTKIDIQNSMKIVYNAVSEDGAVHDRIRAALAQNGGGE